jgi:mannose-1-phosphate guanylyltransferase
MNILILAGGTGTRLWPASRKKQPKQLLPFIGNRTLLQNTYERFLKVTTPAHIYVGTLAAYAKAVKKQVPGIPAKNYSLETLLKDRAPAIGLAALIMEHNDPGSCFVTAWSDHYIKEERAYLAMLKKIEKYLRQEPETTVTIGVAPRYAHTGMGYIEQGKSLPNKTGLPLSAVRSFKEKPDLKTATKYLNSGRYLWNTGYFAWNAGYLLRLYREHLPEIYELLMAIKPALGTRRQQAVINRYYPRMPKIDIETGLIEKLNNRVVIAADFTWADIGSWKIIKQVLSDGEENLVNGLWAGIHTSGSLIYNYTDGLIATSGLRDTIIVATPEITLVANIRDSEDIKKLVARIATDPKLHKYI